MSRRVRAHGLARDEEPLGDLALAELGRQQLEDAALGGCQRLRQPALLEPLLQLLEAGAQDAGVGACR